jgi:hypothetical protein
VEGHLDILYGRACANEEVVSKIKKIVITNFPNSGVSMISRRQGVVLVPKGDAFLLGECKTLTLPAVNLSLSRKIGDICFKHYPILNDNDIVGYLRLPDHKILKTSPTVVCADITINFIEDNKNVTYLVSVNGTLTVVKVSAVDEPFTTHVAEIFGYAEELIEDTSNLLDPPSLLQLISETSAQIEELQSIHDLGGGSLHLGVAQIFGAILHAAASAGGYLLKAASGLVTQVVSSLASGASKLVKTMA